MNLPVYFVLFWKGFLGAGLASLGFGVLFNVRGWNLVLSGLTGAIGGLVYTLLIWLNWGEGMSNFIAAIAIGVLGEYFARRQKTTVTTFTAPALIPLVPGGTAYEMMVDFATGQVGEGAIKMINLLSIAGMLAMGMLIVSTLTRFFFYSKRQVENTRAKIIRLEQGKVDVSVKRPRRIDLDKASAPILFPENDSFVHDTDSFRTQNSQNEKGIEQTDGNKN